MRKNFKFKDTNGLEINAYKWIPDNECNIKAVIQIAHGMAEPILRYDYFANKLCENGYIVYGNDHRGHGLTAKNKEEFGYLGDNGFMAMVENMKDLSKIIEKNHPKLPLILFGHSMGSFLSQRYAQIYGDSIDGLILSATSGKPPLKMNFGILLSKIEMKLKGEKHRSTIINKLSFGDFNNKFKPCRTEFDWLCSVEKEVDKYIANDYCGFVNTSSFYYDFFKGLKELHEPKNMDLIPKKLPIYIFAGDKDPVGNFGKGILDLYSIFKKNNIENVKYKLYKEGRHEMLNEVNKGEVISDVLEWIKNTMKY